MGIGDGIARRRSQLRLASHASTRLGLARSLARIVLSRLTLTSGLVALIVLSRLTLTSGLVARIVLYRLTPARILYRLTPARILYRLTPARIACYADEWAAVLSPLLMVDEDTPVPEAETCDVASTDGTASVGTKAAGRGGDASRSGSGKRRAKRTT